MPEVLRKVSPKLFKPNSTKKSGYAAELRPDLLEPDELAGRATPIASETGAQAGRIPAAQRKTGSYEAITLGEAQSRMQARMRGELDPIQDGLDQPGRPKTGMAPVDLAIRPELDKSADIVLQPPITPLPQSCAPVSYQLSAPYVEPVPRQTTPYEQYLTVGKRVQFSLPGGTYSIPAIDVKATDAGLIILLPFDEQHATFIPEPGTDIRVAYNGQQWVCFFPGTAFDIEELGATVITMLVRSA